MRDLIAQDQRAALLPCSSSRLFVVLFWRSSDSASPAFRAQCAHFDWPRCFEAVSVDLDRAPELEAWFDLRTVPVLAVVADGAILSVQHDCTEEACRRLARCGRRQYALLVTTSL